MKVPIGPPSLNDDDVKAVSSAVSSGWISGRGRYVTNFEQEYGAWLGIKNVISCTSGTTALHLALVALNVKQGDEVIIPAFSMGAVPFAVAYTGAKSVLVDSETKTWNMNPDEVERKLTSKTKAVIAMHTYGHMVDMGPLVDLCKRKGISLIEDAAEAHGAEYNGIKAGTIGDVNCFSFFANKIITTGEGGAVVTDHEEIAEKCRILRDMAFSNDLSKKFLHEYIGYNYRMTNMQAALGSSQLKRIESFIGIRRRNAAIYTSLLSKVNGIVTHPEASWAKNVYWMYSILVKPEYGFTRDELMSKLSDKGIETRPFFVPVHQQPVFAAGYQREAYPNAEMLARCGLNLPSGNTLTEEEVKYTASAIASLGKQGAKS
jgi:perosamine synthetase